MRIMLWIHDPVTISSFFCLKVCFDIRCSVQYALVSKLLWLSTESFIWFATLPAGKHSSLFWSRLQDQRYPNKVVECHVAQSADFLSCPLSGFRVLSLLHAWALSFIRLGQQFLVSIL
jgi:hypothetical protein